MPARREQPGGTAGGVLVPLARAAGVQPSYVDVHGRRHAASAESLVAVLRRVGVPIESPGGASEALDAFRRQRNSLACEPVAIAWGGASVRVRVHAARQGDTRAARCRLRLEDGSELEWTARPPRAGVRRLKGKDGNAERFAFELRTPPALPFGAHTLTIDAGATRARTTLLSSPRRCWRPPARANRSLGIFAPVYALRSDSCWGIGDLSSLRELSAWAGASGCSFVGTLPLLACYLDKPFDPSPYAPVSRLFWNELFIDLEGAPEFERSAPARRLATRSQGALRALRRKDLVDYRACYALKRRVLDALAAQAFADPIRRRQVEVFSRRSPDVGAYADFRATVETHGRTWRQWPDPSGGVGRAQKKTHAAHARTHLYSQFLLSEQLASAGRVGGANGLYLDLPVGVHAEGFDTWRFRKTFAEGLAVGAPPDAFFASGQNWGLPLIDPWASRLDGHAYFRASVRTLLQHCAVLRIDHVMGLHRLYCIPEGFDGAHGAYVRQPAEELYAALCIESNRAGAEVVGENLGTVPPEVNTALRRRGILKMHVSLFEFRSGAKRACREPARDELASLNTHDTATFAAFWRGSDISLRRRLGIVTGAAAAKERRGRTKLTRAIASDLTRRGLLERGRKDNASVLRAMLRLLSRGKASRVLVNLEDLWGEVTPQNVPGVSVGYPVWRLKARRSLRAITSDPKLSGLLAELARLRSARGTRRRRS